MEIEIFKRGNKYYEDLFGLHRKKGLKIDEKNAENRQVLGIELLTGFSFNDDSYTDGKIYDPESGKTYDCKMTLRDNILKVRGY